MAFHFSVTGQENVTSSDYILLLFSVALMVVAGPISRCYKVRRVVRNTLL